jgi:hypothetical protein
VHLRYVLWSLVTVITTFLTTLSGTSQARRHTVEVVDDPKQVQEIWMSTTGGTTYVHVKDPRNVNGWVQKKVGGKGSQRITLSIEEREFNQELVAYESQHHDPFTNGLLVRIAPKGVERSQYEVNDEELVALLKGGEDEDFEEMVVKTHSEVVLRRMLFLAERNTTLYRHNVLRDTVAERYSIGKTQQVVREIQEDDAKFAASDL